MNGKWLAETPTTFRDSEIHLKFCSCQLRDLEASAAISSFMLLERRASPRLPEFKRAESVFNDNRSRMVCIVVNASEQGAMLRVRDGADVPDTFNLHMDDKIHAAWVVWQNNGALGVNWLD